MIRIGSVTAVTYMDPEWIIINTHIEFVDLAFRDEPRVLNRPGLMTEMIDLAFRG